MSKKDSDPGPAAGDLARIKAEADASAARLNAANAAVDAAAEAQYMAAAKDLKEQKKADPYTDKRSGDVIFRRELGEPEFWLDKKDRVPPRPVLSDAEVQEISKKAEIPADQTPKYEPKHILSEEFGGSSSYEVGIGGIKKEAQLRLKRLQESGADEAQIRAATEDLRKLDHLHENYSIGMNVFRTAKGGREKIKK